MEFAKVRYAQKSSTGVIYKNLNTFAEANPDNVDFIRKYLTLTRCDLFFADKAIFVEGASERLLLPDIVGRTGALSLLRQTTECNFRVRPLDEWKASI